MIVPVYGVADLAREALASLRSQTCEDWEAIVVDDGDREDASAAFAPFACDRRFRLLQTDNRGVSTARNRAIAVSRAPYIALLDGDDLYEVTYLARMLAALEADPGLGFVCCDALVFGPRASGAQLYSQRYPMDGPVTLERVLRRDVHIFTGGVIRRAALDQIGGFDPELRAAEDLDLWIRLLAAGWRARFLPEPLVRYRRRAGSLSTQERPLVAASCQAYRKSLAALEGRPEQEVARAVLRALEQQLCRLNGEALILNGDCAAGLHALSMGADDLSPRWRFALALMRRAPWLAVSLMRLRPWLPAPRTAGFS